MIAKTFDDSWLQLLWKYLCGADIQLIIEPFQLKAQ